MTKPNPIKSKSIYFDVGSWQSGKKGRPTMTFGLIEHNAIALCSYFSDGRETFHIPSKIGNQKYNFQMSLINEFLTIMMNNKYGYSFRFHQYQITLKKYHVRWLIPFPPKSLLQDEDTLIILIPDLHLHFFKGTYLDNFVTYYEKRWDGDKPGDKPTGQRRSMEIEFGNFLRSVIEFQKEKESNITVVFLGDTYEMWESQILFDYFGIKKMTLREVYRDFQAKIEEIKDVFDVGSDYRAVIEQILKIKIHEKPSDQELVKQIDALKEVNLEELYIKENDSKKEIWTKASNLIDAIDKKYKDENGTTFNNLFGNIANADYLHGNHDNYTVLPNLDPILGNPDDEYGEGQSQIEIEPFIRTKQSRIFIHHGHLFDDYNNDDNCHVGYLLTGVNALFEGKKYGDYFKKFEEVFRSGSEVREDLIKKTCEVFQYWSKSLKSDPKEKKKPKSEFNIMIHAHTHKPKLENITAKCRRI